MKACIKSLPVLFLFLVSCNKISFVESCVCDELQDYCCLVDVIITEDKIEFNNKSVDSLSQISGLVWDARDSFGDRDGTMMACKLYIDKSCTFSFVNSVINEFRKASLLKTYLKVNDTEELCWCLFYVPTWGGINYDAINLSDSERDSLNLIFAEYYSKDSVLVNGNLKVKEVFASQLNTIIESEQQYHYFILPKEEDSFGEVFSLVNLYLNELEKLKKRYIPSGKNPVHEYNDEEQLYHFEEKYSRKYSIMYSNYQE